MCIYLIRLSGFVSRSTNNCVVEMVEVCMGLSLFALHAVNTPGFDGL